MFHPLVTNLKEINDTDLEKKIMELMKNYGFAARTGNGGLCSQLAMLLNDYKEEQQRRQFEKSKVSVKNQDKDLGDLINVN